MAAPDQDRPDLIPLIDLEPAKAEAVIDAMTNVGLEGVPYRLDPGAREATLAKAVVRIYVPRRQLRDARAVVRGVLPEYGGASGPTRPETLASADEKAWADIVADLRSDGFDEPAVPPAVPASEPSEHFVAPEPPPIPRISRPALLSWVALIGGIAIAMLGASAFAEPVVTLLGMGLFLTGFVSLVYRLSERDSDDYDDGAVV